MLDKSTDQRNDIMVAPFVFPFLARTILQDTSTETDDKTIKKSTVVGLLTIHFLFFYFFPKRQVIFTSEDNKISRVYVIKRTDNFWSSKTLFFENEFSSHEKKQPFSYYWFTFSLALKERLGTTQK